MVLKTTSQSCWAQAQFEYMIKAWRTHVHESTVQALPCLPYKQVVNMEMHTCVYSPPQHPRLSLYQIKLKHYLRGVWPFVTDVQDNLMNITTKDLVLLHSLLLTNHFGYFRRHDSQIKRYHLGEIISQKKPRVFQNLKPRHAREERSAEESISGWGGTHFMPLFPSVQRETWQQVSVEEAQTKWSPALMPLKGDWMKRWLVSTKRLKAVRSGVQENMRLKLSNEFVKCRHSRGTE